MRSTLDDIDEDEPAPLVIPAPSASRPPNPSVMDDLFGAAPAASSGTPAASSPAPTEEQKKKTADVLDDFFGKPSAGRPAAAATSASSSQISKGGGGDPFDSLFSSAPPSTAQQAQAAVVSSRTDQATTVQPTRSAKDQLDAFSAVMSGGAAPWMKTTSVADSRAMDFDGAAGSSTAGRVFVPPDSVLSLMTLYDVLGAAPTWTTEEINKSYKKKALALHPDKLQGGRTEAEERYFKIITASYDVLKDSEKRAEYDAALKTGSATGSSSWLSFVA